MSYVLIVDDDADFVNATAMVLKRAGHEVETQLDTDGVVRKIMTRRPDLIILDVMFPENDAAGFEVARALRDDHSIPSIPILMLTAVNTRFPLGFNRDDIDESWLPITDFLEKPVDFDVLEQKVKQLLAQR